MNSCKLCSESNIKQLYDLNKFKMFQCRSCEVIFIDPFMQDDSVKDLFDALYTPGEIPEKNLSKEVLELYSHESEHSALSVDHSDYLTRVERFKEKGSLIDIGCGTGAFLHACKLKGWEVSGVEISPQAVQFAQEEYKISVHTGKLEDVHLPEDSYDVVTMLDFIEHVPNPLTLLSEAYRILHKGGYLFVALPNFDSLLGKSAHSIHHLSFGLITSPLKIIYPPTHFFYFTPITFKKVLENQGFSVELIEQEGTDLRLLNLNPVLYFSLRILFWISRRVHKQNRLLVLAKK